VREVINVRLRIASLVTLALYYLMGPGFAQTHPLLPAALAVATKLDLTGNSVTIDSFDSSNTNLFPGGVYNSTNALDLAQVLSLSRTNYSIMVGNSRIKGTVGLAPDGSVSLSPGGSVGDANWVNGGQFGIQLGHVSYDAAFVTFPDATLPDTGDEVWQFAVPGAYVINGVTYKYLLSSSRPWKISNLDGGVYVNGPRVKLWVLSAINLPNFGGIRIPAMTDSLGQAYSLEMYVTAGGANLGGSGVINETGVARDFQYFGLPSNTSLTIPANGPFVGVIYAPAADFTLGGGSNNTNDFIGCSVTKSVKMNGHFNFHLDESLGYAVYNSPAPVLRAFGFSAGNQFQFTVTGLAGFTYAVEASLSLTDWVSLVTNTSPFTFVDGDSTNFPQRFYRANYLP